jgi:hypothetical protein
MILMPDIDTRLGYDQSTNSATPHTRSLTPAAIVGKYWPGRVPLNAYHEPVEGCSHAPTRPHGRKPACQSQWLATPARAGTRLIFRMCFAAGEWLA